MLTPGKSSSLQNQPHHPLLSQHSLEEVYWLTTISKIRSLLLLVSKQNKICRLIDKYRPSKASMNWLVMKTKKYMTELRLSGAGDNPWGGEWRGEYPWGVGSLDNFRTTKSKHWNSLFMTVLTYLSHWASDAIGTNRLKIVPDLHGEVPPQLRWHLHLNCI